MRATEAAARLTLILHQLLTGKCDRVELIRRLDLLVGELTAANQSEEETDKQAAERAAETESANAVFRYWQRVMGKQRAKPTSERLNKVRSRLHEGYSVDDLCRAIDGCAESTFHQGDNERGEKYDDLTLILRSGAMVERFMDRVGCEPHERRQRDRSEADARDRDTLARLDELEQQGRIALQEGKTDAYNRIQDEIRTLRAPAPSAGRGSPRGQRPASAG